MVEKKFPANQRKGDKGSFANTLENMSNSDNNIRGFFLKKNTESWRNGYILPVRNRMNDLLENEFIPEELKDRYLKQWGENIIYDDQFVDWYCEMRKNEDK